MCIVIHDRRKTNEKYDDKKPNRNVQERNS